MVPASTILETNLPDGRITYLPDLWRDLERNRKICEAVFRISIELTDAIQREVFGFNKASLRLIHFDIVHRRVGDTLEKMLRLIDAKWPAEGFELWPKTVDIICNNAYSSGDFFRFDNVQSGQWALLRTLANGHDPQISQTFSLRHFHRWFLGRLASPKLPAHIQKTSEWLHAGPDAKQKSLGNIPTRGIPDFVKMYPLGKAKSIRKRIGELFTEILTTEFKNWGADCTGLRKSGELLAKQFPCNRIEFAEENLSQYRKFVERADATGCLVTEYDFRDERTYAISACRDLGKPVIFFQHGGLYGYEASVSNIHAIEFTAATHFISWGWSKYPETLPAEMRKTRIVPLASPSLSELNVSGRRFARPANPADRTLLIPMSKARTLDLRTGTNASDGNIPQLRSDVAKIIRSVPNMFSRFIITFRSDMFEFDPFKDELSSLSHLNIEIHDYRNRKASSFFETVDAVYWDINATGILESLRYGLPSVVRLVPGRMEKDLRWAENYLLASGIGCLTPEEAAQNLTKFVCDANVWSSARSGAKAFLDKFAAINENYSDELNAVISSIGRGLEIPDTGCSNAMSQG